MQGQTQFEQKVIDQLKEKVKGKECELNILINQKSLVEMEQKTEISKQMRTIGKLKKELKNI